VTPEDLHQDTLRRLVQRKTEAQRIAAARRRLQAEAMAAGDAGTARQLGMLAAHMEQAAALAEAERRDRIAGNAKLQGGRKARASSASMRAAQANADAFKVAEPFKSAYRDGMGGKALMDAAKALLAERDRKARDRLSLALAVGNKGLEDQLQAELENIKRQIKCCTRHYAQRWLQQPHNTG